MSDGSRKSFPFSPSPFLGESVRGAIRQASSDPLRAGVTEFYISDERGRKRSKFGGEGSGDSGSIPDHLLALLSQQRFSPQSGLRLLSLESFVWGSKGFPPQPRTRLDHTLIWVFTGNVQLDYPRQSQLIGQDAVHYIPAGTAFAAVPQPGGAGFVLLLSRALTDDIDPPFPSAPLSGLAGASAEALLQAVTALTSEDNAVLPADRTSMLATLSHQLSLLQPPKAPHRPVRNVNVENRPLVERFIALASTSLKQGYTIGEMADELGASAGTLDQACLKARGKRAVELIHQLRLEQAIELLRNRYHSPAQIAKELGYTSLAHFTRAFVEATGHRPETFRDKGY